MFEFAKILFIAMLLIAASMIKPGLKDLKERTDRAKGDTTNIFKQDLEWKQKLEKAIQEAVVKTDSKFGIEEYKKSLNQILQDETTSNKNSKDGQSNPSFESGEEHY